MDYLPASEAAATDEELALRELSSIPEVGWIKLPTFRDEFEYGIYRVIMFVARAAKWTYQFVMEKIKRR
jgi:hypothetical protein